MQIKRGIDQNIHMRFMSLKGVKCVYSNSNNFLLLVLYMTGTKMVRTYRRIAQKPPDPVHYTALLWQQTHLSICKISCPGRKKKGRRGNSSNAFYLLQLISSLQKKVDLRKKKTLRKKHKTTFLQENCLYHIGSV